MIQPATLPATAKLLLAIDPQVANGEMTAFDMQFSKLLAANFMPPADMVPGKAEAAPDVALPFKTQLRPANDKVGGKVGGKTGGKILPDSPVLAAFASLLKQSRGTGEANGDASTARAQTDETALAASEVASQLPTPAFAIPVTVNPALVPAPAASAIAPAMPLPVAEPVQSAAIASSQIQPASTDAHSQPRARSAPATPGSDAPTAEESPASLEPTTPAPAGSAKANPATPDTPAPELPQSRPETLPLVIQSGLTTHMVLVPRSQMPLVELGKLQTMAIEQAKIGEAGLQIAKVQVRQAPEDHAARTVTTLPQVDLATVTATPEVPQARSIASSDAEKPQETPQAALARLDAAPLLTADPAAALDATPAGATGPAPASAPSRTPDFAALIDRLVEARAAAQATRETHTVDAAIQHADFGQVSLQFRHDAAGLSVVMASADPDLAKALQVAAPSGGSFSGQFSNSGDGNAPQWRQDSSGQSASSPSSNSTGQTQSQTTQHRGQAPQRAPDQPNGTANPSPRSRSQTDPTARSGIFA